MFDFEKPRIEIAEISEDKKYGRFVVEPLERGYGTTLGNSLRRIMLSSLPGSAVSQIKIDGVVHEFSGIPGAKEDSIHLLHWIRETLPEHQYLISIMSQYTPFYKSSEYPKINRRITSYEYNKVVDTAIDLGLTEGFMQERSSAKEEYTPPFDCEGI